MQSLATRMKANYESRCRHFLVRRMPVIIRVDGRAFHTFTRGMDRPFDERFMAAMTLAAIAVSQEIQGFKAGYVQSDEASFFLTDYDTTSTESWFGYTQSKVETIAASVMTASFNRVIRRDTDAHFDARAFSIPREEVANYFLWRAKDWERNSLAMYCGSFFSHRQMRGKKRQDQHDMLHGIGKNWATDLSSQEKNGLWIFDGCYRSNLLPRYDDIAEVLNPSIYCDKENSHA